MRMNEEWEKLFKARYNGRPAAAGRVLVAEPFLCDAGFGRSVVYLTDHDGRGSVGFVLNKPLNVEVGRLVAGLEGVRMPVYFGGPVGRDNLFYIHRRDDIPDSAPVGGGVYYGGDFVIVAKMAREGWLRDDEIRFFAGYSGWEAGQLDRELRGDSWLVGELPPGEIFAADCAAMWRRAMERLGTGPAIWAKFPEDPGMN